MKTKHFSFFFIVALIFLLGSAFAEEEVYVFDEKNVTIASPSFGNYFNSRASARRNLTILANTTSDANITIFYSSGETWKNATCTVSENCTLLIEKAMSDVELNYYILFSYSSHSKRVPDAGTYKVKLYEHPVAFFTSKKLKPIVGKDVVVYVKMRNIGYEKASVHANVSDGKFLSTESDEVALELDPTGEKMFLVRVGALGSGKHEVCMDSHLENTFDDGDCLSIEYVLYPSLPSENMYSLTLIIFITSLLLFLKGSKSAGHPRGARLQER